MKRILILLSFLVGLALHAPAQKVIQKNLEVAGKNVELKFDFADTIEIEAYDKNTLALEISVNIDHNRHNDIYKLNTEENGNLVRLEEFVGFKMLENLGDKNIEKMIVYRLKVPQNLKFSLKTIAGQVVLKGTTGQADINSVSGFIDYSVPATSKAQIKLSTVTGNVYSNLKFDDGQGKENQWFGVKRTLKLNGGGIPVSLTTVSGDIYLRK